MSALDVTVIVASYGERLTWDPLAARAAASIPEDVRRWVFHRDEGTLASVRNECARNSFTEWLCFLDADDELEPGYFEAMAQGAADLRAPLVRYVLAGRRGGSAKIPAGTPNMADGNRLVIGTLVRKTMFDAVGGFREWPFYEDWDLWLRCWLAGASIEFTQAVYRAHVRRESRNRRPKRREKERVHHAIRRANMPWLYEAEAGHA